MRNILIKILTDNDVQSRSNGVDHSDCGVTHAVCGAYVRHSRSERRGWVSRRSTVCSLTPNTSVLTRRDDANVERTRLQSDSWVVLTKACLLLRPANQTVEYFTEHAIPTHTHHTGINKHKGSIVRAPPTELSPHKALIPQWLHSGSYPSKPVRSFFRRWSLAWLARSVTEKRNVIMTGAFYSSCLKWS